MLFRSQGLNITVQSYLDRLDFGLLADPDLVPDLDAMLDAILADIDTLAPSSGFTPPVSDASGALPKQDRERV